MAPELSVLFVNYNTWAECAAAIRSLRQHPPTRPDGTPMPYECIVVDNASPLRPQQAIDALEAELAAVRAEQHDERSGALHMHAENLGYSRGVNHCLDRSRGKYVLVSNPDLLYTPGLVDALHRELVRNPKAGCTVPKGYWDPSFLGRLPPNTLPTLWDVAICTLGEFVRPLAHWYARHLLRQWLRTWSAEQPVVLPMMSGCLFMVERGYFESIGRMDDRYPLYYEDSDLSVRIAASGRGIVQVPEAKLVHFVNRSGQTDFETMMKRHGISRRLYFEKWYGRAGLWVLDACDWMMRTPLLRKLRGTPPGCAFTDLGESAERPVIRLPRSCDRFLLLMGLDARFYLSGALWGTGDSWTPSDELFGNFAPTTYWYRAYDIGNGRLELLGTWQYRCRRGMAGAAGP